MPGGEVLTRHRRAGARGHHLSPRIVKHENAAGFMAEGVHHVDGAPAILVADGRPGGGERR
jgi:acetolactate synthase-1/2/3 large subunit